MSDRPITHLTSAPPADATGAPADRDRVRTLLERFAPTAPPIEVGLGCTGAELLALAEACQDAVDRLGLGLDGSATDIEALTLVGVRALASVAVTPPSSREEVRRRARIYARQRCDGRVATMLAYSLEHDRRARDMGVRELA